MALVKPVILRNFLLPLFGHFVAACSINCCVADIGFHEVQLAISLHKQWLNSTGSLTVSHQGTGRKILSRYLSGMRQLRESVASQLVTYDIHAMFVGILMLWIVSWT